MVQSIWLDFQDDVNAEKLLDILRDSYGLKSIEQEESELGEKWELELNNIDFVNKFLLSKKVRINGGRRRLVTPEATCEHEENLLGTYMKWYALELRDLKGDTGLSLGRDIWQMHCLDYYDRLRILGYSLRYIQKELQNKGIDSTLDMRDTETRIKQSVMHYKI